MPDLSKANIIGSKLGHRIQVVTNQRREIKEDRIEEGEDS